MLFWGRNPSSLKWFKGLWNKYYDWKYLWILVRNDLNTSGMKYLYVIDLVCSIWLWRVRDRWHIFDMIVLWYLILYQFEKGFVLNPEGNLFWYKRIYIISNVWKELGYCWRTIWKDILKLYIYLTVFNIKILYCINCFLY